MTGSITVPGTVKTVVPANSLHPSETAEILVDGASLMVTANLAAGVRWVAGFWLGWHG
jgi:hypothetical protein